MIKAILFDMDGVLMDSNIHHFKSFNQALALVGYHITFSEHQEIYEGLPSKLKLKILSEKKGLDASHYAFLIAEKLKFLTEIIKNDIHVDEAKREMLKYLRNKGLKLACCSNATRNSLNLLLEKTGLFDCFDLVISNEDIINPKPDPEMYLKAMDIFGCHPKEVYILEDSENGLQAAYSSGANVIKINSVSEVTLSLFDKLLS